MNEAGLDHFELRRYDSATHLRGQRGGGTGPPRSPRKHGRRLLGKAEAVLRDYDSRRRLDGISPRLVFRLVLNRLGSIDEKQLSRMGLTFISRDPSKTLVVFASDGHLDRFRSYLRQYGGLEVGRKYKYLAAIDDIKAIGRDDRVGYSLHRSPVGPDEIAPLDVELMHPGERKAAEELVREIADAIAAFGGRVSDSYIGNCLALVRCHCTREACGIVLDTGFVMTVERPPQPAFDLAEILGISLDAIPDIEELPEETPGVLVMDTGVMGNHPLLKPALGEAASFLGSPENQDAWPPSADPQGHGTKVCGIAAYGDFRESFATGEFKPSAQLFSGRVLDESCRYDPERLVENQLAECIRYFVDTYPQCKVVNLSLGDGFSYFRPGARQFRLAARIDELAYDLGDKDIVFVVSSGNLITNSTYEKTFAGYPAYLLEDHARIIDPATSALALTVGSIATGGGPEASNAMRRCVAGVDEYPSPFTRTGLGVGGMVKPDLVHYGGDIVFEGEKVVKDRGGCMPTTSHEFAPPNARLFTFDMGSSYSAAAVSNLAARLFARFPDASSNLIRALLVDSATLPECLPGYLQDRESIDTLRVYGYGKPDFAKAAYSGQDRVLLVSEATLPVDGFHLYEVPPLPPEYLAAKGQRRISVTLAFDPPTRHTRGDSYLGVAMGFDLFRNATLGEIEPIFRDWSLDPAGEGEDMLRVSLGDLRSRQRVDMFPGPHVREKGTLQKSVECIGARWAYNEEALLLAVHCSRKWAPADVETQRYAIVVSLSHSNPSIRLWDHVRNHARIMSRARIRV